MGKVGQVVTRFPVSEWANRRGTTSNDPIPTRNTPPALLSLITNRRYVTVRSRISSRAKWQRNSATKQHSIRVIAPTKAARPCGSPSEERNGFLVTRCSTVFSLTTPHVRPNGIEGKGTRTIYTGKIAYHCSRKKSWELRSGARCPRYKEATV